MLFYLFVPFPPLLIGVRAERISTSQRFPSPLPSLLFRENHTDGGAPPFFSRGRLQSYFLFSPPFFFLFRAWILQGASEGGDSVSFFPPPVGLNEDAASPPVIQCGSDGPFPSRRYVFSLPLLPPAGSAEAVRSFLPGTGFSPPLSTCNDQIHSLFLKTKFGSSASACFFFFSFLKPKKTGQPSSPVSFDSRLRAIRGRFPFPPIAAIRLGRRDLFLPLFLKILAGGKTVALPPLCLDQVDSSVGFSPLFKPFQRHFLLSSAFRKNFHLPSFFLKNAEVMPPFFFFFQHLAIFPP